MYLRDVCEHCIKKSWNIGLYGNYYIYSCKKNPEFIFDDCTEPCYGKPCTRRIQCTSMKDPEWPAYWHFPYKMIPQIKMEKAVDFIDYQKKADNERKLGKNI